MVYLQAAAREKSRARACLRLAENHQIDLFINLAIKVRADYLVSRDKDLLDLMDWSREAGRDFQKRFRFLKITTPEAFLDEIEKSKAAE
jgi:predicted nucleic acid-binding protein